MILEIDPQHPAPRKIRIAVDALRKEGVIAYPTDTVYGLGCDLGNKKAIDRLYRIKGTSQSQPLAFLCSDLTQASKFVLLDDYVYRMLKRFLPGPYCFILPATRDVPRSIQSARKTVGIRIPNHVVALALVKELGGPLISTTAARHGEDPDPDARELATRFPELDLILDAGACGVEPTSVIDLTGKSPKVIREGAGDVTAFRE